MRKIKKVGTLIWNIVLIYAIGCCFFKVILLWIIGKFHVSMESLIFTLKAPKTNANTSVVKQAMLNCIPKIVIGLIIIYCIWALIKKIEKKSYKISIVCKMVCITILIGMNLKDYKRINNELDISGYLSRREEKTTLYEEHYISPDSVAITDDTTNGTRNLIYIYLESMESNYNYSEGGKTVDLTPNLSKLAQENISFSNGDGKGGFYSPKGTDWTMAGLLATSSGIPFSFPVDGNDMNERKNFAPDLITLGDILNEKGYVQEFVCGSDSEYGGRKLYYKSHGDYEIFDFFSAYPGGWDDYNIGWWGIEDSKLYAYAKNELLNLSNEKKPFNFTLLTVDTHFGDGVIDGYVCNNCKDTYSERYANVVKCADEQIMEFIKWVQTQDFYKNTTIVITGDHPFMGKRITSQEGDSTVYNCIINAVKTTENISNRQYTSFDIFPTVLSAMGFSIEGNKLGLGTDLFSSEKTLMEKIGLDSLNSELSKYSQYYVEHFE